MGSVNHKNQQNNNDSQIDTSIGDIVELTDITKELVTDKLGFRECSESEKSRGLSECCETSIEYTRIYLLRHLPYLDKNEHKLYEDLRKKLKEVEKDKKSNNEIDKELRGSYGELYINLLDKAEGNIYKLFGQLDDNLEVDFSKADKVLLDSIFKDQNNTIFIYNKGESKKRIAQSIDYISKKYPGIKLEPRDIVGSSKGIDKQKSVLKAGIELVDITGDIKSEVLANNPKYVGKNIVILGSRSHSHFLNSNKFDKVGKDTSEKEFEDKGYDLIDLDSKSIIIDNSNVLTITPGNYQKMMTIFPYIKFFSIIDFQKKINALFSSDFSLYSKILLDEKINNHSIHHFCISNLLNKDNDSIEKFLKGNLNKTQKEILEIIKVLKMSSNEPIIKKLIISLGIRAKMISIINLTESVGISTELEKEIENLKQEYEEINTRSKNNIDDIFSNSLDELVRKGNTLDRKLYYYRKKNNTELETIKKEKEEKGDKSELDENEKYSKESIDFEYILSNNNGQSVFVFLANVGEGKSIELAKIARKLENSSEYIPLFYSSKSINQNQGFQVIPDKIHKDINVLKKAFPNKGIVLFFDGIDELKPEIKEEIKILLLHPFSVKKVVLGSRKSEFNELGEYNFLSYTINYKENGKSGNILKSLNYLGKKNNNLLFYSCEKIKNKEDFEKLINIIQNDIELIINKCPGKMITIFLDNSSNIIYSWKNIFIDSFPYNNIDIIFNETNGSTCYGISNKYTSISFENLDNDTRNDYISSRLKSLGVKEEELNTKISSIEYFLNQSILEEELKNTPLIIYFLCVLSKDNEIEKIKNRAQLYEEIVTKIIKEHNKSKGDNTSGDYVKHDLNELSEIAFSISRGEEINISDSKFKKFSILFKKTGNGNYDFIHKSFYEFFLARNLANKINGSNEIYKYRDKAGEEDKRNEWRNYKPVIMFNSEILINNNKIDELKELLGENGLLKNDDIYGEGFFMGLEILHKIEKNDSLKDNFIELKMKYLNIINNGDKKEILNKFVNFKLFQKNNNFEENIFIETYMRRIDDIDVNICIEEKINLGSNTFIKNLISHDNCISIPLYNMYLIKGLDKTGNIKGIQILSSHISDLISKGDYISVLPILYDLTKSKNNYLIECAYNSALLILNLGKINEALDIFYGLFYSGDKKSQDLLYNKAIELFNNSNYLESGIIFGKLSKTGNDEYIIYAEKCIEKLQNKGGKYKIESKKITSILSKIGNSKYSKNNNKGAIELLNKKDYYKAGLIFASGLKNLTKNLDICIENLIKMGKYEEASFLYKAVLENGNTKYFEYVYKGAKLLFKKKRFLESCLLFEKLAETGNDMILYEEIKDKYIITFFEKEMISEGFAILKSFAKSGNIKGMKIAYDFSMKIIDKNFYVKEVYELLCNLTDSGNEIGFNFVYNGAINLWKEHKYYESIWLIVRLYNRGHNKSFEKLNYILDLFANGKIPNTNNKLFDSGLYETLIILGVKLGNEKIISSLKDKIEVLLNTENEHSYSYILEDIKKYGYKF